MNSSNALQMIVTAMLATFGALARFLNKKEQISFQFTHLVSGCFVAAFAGVMAHFVSMYFKLDQNIEFVVAGISGWIGPQAIDALSSMIIRKAGIPLSMDEPSIQIRQTDSMNDTASVPSQTLSQINKKIIE
jgi:hypothetical protein